MTLTGVGFGPGAEVSICDLPCMSPQPESGTSLTCVTSPMSK